MSLFLQNNHDKMILKEDFTSTIDSFMAYAERKLKGYSVKEIDILANKAKHLDSEVGKRETLERIENALADARKELPNAKDDKKKELRLQIQVLDELKSKVNSFKVVEDHSTEKKDDDNEKPEKINLDDR